MGQAREEGRETPVGEKELLLRSFDMLVSTLHNAADMLQMQMQMGILVSISMLQFKS